MNRRHSDAKLPRNIHNFSLFESSPKCQNYDILLRTLQLRKKLNTYIKLKIEFDFSIYLYVINFSSLRILHIYAVFINNEC